MSIEVLRALLAWDDVVQWTGLWLSVVGVSVTLICLFDAVWNYRHAWAWGTVLHQTIARGHVVSQGVLLLVQVTFGVISVLVLTLPPLPVEMYVGEQAQAVVTVVVLRKLLRGGMILVLTCAALAKVVEAKRIRRLSGGEWSDRLRVQ
jgi:hypothetical protein